MRIGPNRVRKGSKRFVIKIDPKICHKNCPNRIQIGSKDLL